MPARRVALVPLVGLLLAGCSGASGEPPKTLPPVTPPPSVATSPSAVAVEVPLAARAETPQGAAAFARFYLAEVARAFAAGSGAGLRNISDPDCDTCNNYIAAADRDGARGYRMQGGSFLVSSAATPAGEGSDVVVDIAYDRTATVKFDRSGERVSAGPPERNVLMQMRLIRREQSWIARGIRFPKSPT